jgi:O-acetyl-ADP-ribose deacetylase (regulator of RNase III)
MEKRKTSNTRNECITEQNDTIKVIKGDALSPETDNPTIIAHVVNDIGAWGAGFVNIISKRWKKPEEMYRKLCKKIDKDLLPGAIQVVDVEENLFICNMFAMNGIFNAKTNPHPLNYDRLLFCLKTLRYKAERENILHIQMPKIGAGLARGNWEVILKLIRIAFKNSNITITIKHL